MYIEILLVAIIIFFLLIYTGSISTSKFFGENKGLFEFLQEKDYEFLLRAKCSYIFIINPFYIFVKHISIFL